MPTPTPTPKFKHHSDLTQAYANHYLGGKEGRLATLRKSLSEQTASADLYAAATRYAADSAEVSPGRYEGPVHPRHLSKLRDAVSSYTSAIDLLVQRSTSPYNLGHLPKGVEWEVTEAQIAAIIPSLVNAVVRSWMPAGRVIAHAQAAEEQGEAAHEVCLLANSFLLLAARARTALSDYQAERRRWARGAGVIDCVIAAFASVMTTAFDAARDTTCSSILGPIEDEFNYQGIRWHLHIQEMAQAYVFSFDKGNALLWGLANGGVSPGAAMHFNKIAVDKFFRDLGVARPRLPPNGG